MDKEEILSKSRKENKDRDLYAREIQAKASNIVVLVTVLLATILFVIESVVTNHFNFGLYAIVFVTSATSLMAKGIWLKNKRDIILSIIYIIITLVLTIVHIYQLMSM